MQEMQALIPGSGRSPGEGDGNSLQYFCLENSVDRGAWWVTLHGISKSWPQQQQQHHSSSLWAVCLPQFWKLLQGDHLELEIWSWAYLNSACDWTQGRHRICQFSSNPWKPSQPSSLAHKPAPQQSDEVCPFLPSFSLSGGQVPDYIWEASEEAAKQHNKRKLMQYVMSLDLLVWGAPILLFLLVPKIREDSDLCGFGWNIETKFSQCLMNFSEEQALQLIETVSQIYQEPSVPHTKYCKLSGKPQPSPDA